MVTHSSLSLALSNNHFPLVETLITAGAKLVGGSSKLNDLLVQSIVANESAVALAVVASGTQLDFADSAGMTPLHLAARGGMHKVAEAIVGKEKSLVDRVAEDGTTPLFWAAARGHLDIVK